MKPIANEPWQLAQIRKTSGIQDEGAARQQRPAQRHQQRRERQLAEDLRPEDRQVDEQPHAAHQDDAEEGDGRRAAQPAKGHVQQQKAQDQDQGVGGDQQQGAAAEAVVGVGGDRAAPAS